MIFPVKAKKDPKVFSNNIMIDNLDEFFKHCITFEKDTAKYLFLFSRLLCPHNWLDDNTYFNVVIKIDKDCANDNELMNYVIEIKNMFKTNSLLDKNNEDIIIILKQFEKRNFFQAFLKKVIFYLYDDLTVWEGCGYEGVSGCKKLDVREGINDIDWLPEPPEDLNF